ncbi:MAG: divalent-cation tolerance protein CutA [Acidobacteria bacterium]|nr:divalent-cation tolerance protein CutA [Acidobacteriota bacterium]
MTDKIVVLVTTNGVRQAKRIARALLDQRLAACANLITPIRSLYRWQGKIAEDRECLMVIKTTRGEFDALRACVEKLHTYSVPEVIALPIIDGAENYLSWVAESVAKSEE